MRYAKCREAIAYRGIGLYLRNLSIEVARREALTETCRIVRLLTVDHKAPLPTSSQDRTRLGAIVVL
jgi:hypothetical protein